MPKASIAAAAADTMTKAAGRVEGAAVLDRPAEWLSRASSPLTRWNRSWLSGSWLGHPLHPALVAGPIGFFSGTTVLDLLGQSKVARKLLGAGLVAVGPTALTGLSDWLDTSGPERRVGTAHMSLNLVALGFYAASYRSRRAGHDAAGVVLAAAGAAILGGAGWLGGHLSYGLGVGVDTNAFSAEPVDWTDIGPVPPEDGSPIRATAGSTAVVASRQHGRVCALADRCSHRGGPLSEGEIGGGAITCPWHGSRFDLTTGHVVSGPAVAPQPVYQTEIRDGRLYVRRDEERTLRANPARP